MGLPVESYEYCAGGSYPPAGGVGSLLHRYPRALPSVRLVTCTMNRVSASAPVPVTKQRRLTSSSPCDGPHDVTEQTLLLPYALTWATPPCPAMSWKRT